MFRLGRRPALDGVRGVAILAVLAFHLQDDMRLGTRGGWLGVQLFFVLSGFLITSLLVEEHLAIGTVRLASFYRRRARRLLPALLAFLPLVCAYETAAGHCAFFVRREAAATIAYVDNWYRAYTHDPSTVLSHMWSLSIEEQFYLVWPALLILVLRRSLRGAFWASVGVAVLSAAWRAYECTPTQRSSASTSASTPARTVSRSAPRLRSPCMPATSLRGRSSCGGLRSPQPSEPSSRS